MLVMGVSWFALTSLPILGIRLCQLAPVMTSTGNFEAGGLTLA